MLRGSSLKDQVAHFSQLRNELKKTNINLEKIQTEHSTRMNKMQRDSAEKVASFVTVSDIAKVNNRFRDYATHKDFENHQNVIQPLVELCRKS